MEFVPDAPAPLGFAPDSDMSGVQAHIASRAPREAKTFEDYIYAGLQRTSLGMATRHALPAVEVGPDTPWYGRAVSGVADAVASLPVWGAGGVAGGIAVSGVASPLAAPVGIAGGAFALDNMIRRQYVDMLTKGSITGPGDFAQRTLNLALEGFKGAGTGAAMATAGAVTATNFAASSALKRGVAVTAAEVAAMAAAGALLSNRLPTFEEAMDAAIVIGGMKAARPVTQKLLDIYSRTGKQPHEVVADASRDPTITLDLKPVEVPLTTEPMVTVFHGSPHEFTQFDASKIGTGEGAQAYGHGLYFAENPKVAGNYMNFGNWTQRASGQAPITLLDGKPVEFNKAGNAVGDFYPALGRFLSRVTTKGDYELALEEARSSLAEMQ